VKGKRGVGEVNFFDLLSGASNLLVTEEVRSCESYTTNAPMLTTLLMASMVFSIVVFNTGRLLGCKCIWNCTMLARGKTISSESKTMLLA
jgi:hypothetical protein